MFSFTGSTLATQQENTAAVLETRQSPMTAAPRIEAKHARTILLEKSKDDLKEMANTYNANLPSIMQRALIADNTLQPHRPDDEAKGLIISVLGSKLQYAKNRAQYLLTSASTLYPDVAPLTASPLDFLAVDKLLEHASKPALKR